MRSSLAATVLLALAIALPIEVWADTVTVRGQIATSAELNPDYRGRPSPVNLIIFQLTSSDAFQNADFFSLYDADNPILGDDVIARTQMLLQPGDERELEAEFDERAQYIGVIAAFRDIESAQWRALVELPQRGFIRNLFSRTRLAIDVDALAVTVSLE